jgi:hypothetical protein
MAQANSRSFDFVNGLASESVPFAQDDSVGMTLKLETQHKALVIPELLFLTKARAD